MGKSEKIKFRKNPKGYEGKDKLQKLGEPHTGNK